MGPARRGRVAERHAARSRRCPSAAAATAASRCSGSSRPTRAGWRRRSTGSCDSPTGCGRWGRSPRRCARSRPPGSTAWSRCAAARGVDAAAGQLIVREGGGAGQLPRCSTTPLAAPLDVAPSVARGRRALARDARALWRGSRNDRLDHRRADRHVRRRHRRRAGCPRRPHRAGRRVRGPGDRLHGTAAGPPAAAAGGHQPPRMGPTQHQLDAGAARPGAQARRQEPGPAPPGGADRMGLVVSTEVGVVSATWPSACSASTSWCCSTRPSRIARRGCCSCSPTSARRVQAFGADEKEFMTWVALHEVTHAVQFAGVPWLHSHVAGLVRELLNTAELRIESRPTASPSCPPATRSSGCPARCGGAT